MIQGSLVWPLDPQKLKTTIKLTIAVNRKELTRVDESTTKLARNGSAWGTGPAVLNRVNCVGNTNVFHFGFYFMSPKIDQN